MNRYTLFSIITLCFVTLISPDIYGMQANVQGAQADTEETDEKAEKSKDYEGDEGDGAEEQETEEVGGGIEDGATALELMIKQRIQQDKLVGSEKDSDKALLLQDVVLKNPSVLTKLKKVLYDPVCRSVRHVGEVAGVYQLSNTIWLCNDIAYCFGISAGQVAMCTATGGVFVIALADLGLTVYDLLCYARGSKDKNLDSAQVWTAS